METKSWYKSKTLWGNVGAMVAGYLLNNAGVLQQAGLDAQSQVVVLAIANMVLRFVTNSGLTK